MGHGYNGKKLKLTNEKADQSKEGSSPSSQSSKRGFGFGTIVRRAASVASVAAKHAYAAAAATRGPDEEMLPLKCCLMSISLPWEDIAYDLLFKGEKCLVRVVKRMARRRTFATQSESIQPLKNSTGVSPAIKVVRRWFWPHFCELQLLFFHIAVIFVRQWLESRTGKGQMDNNFAMIAHMTQVNVARYLRLMVHHMPNASRYTGDALQTVNLEVLCSILRKQRRDLPNTVCLVADIRYSGFYYVGVGPK
ncbi:similar to CW7 [Actinidia rufa]|uniref:Similar to CW7 n=1 Tax=Actinidia rufa TaxID=165716 RepID=A0A7J0DWH6_9ERIC|nr:similar to CW7 [Actinidia rufa]